MWHLLEAVQFSGSHVWGDLKTVIDFHLSREEMLSQSSLVSSMSFDEPVCLAFVSMFYVLGPSLFGRISVRPDPAPARFLHSTFPMTLFALRAFHFLAALAEFFRSAHRALQSPAHIQGSLRSPA